ncbi:unnamed protein product [Protopolystoma xenopodis]|uniref:Uncharacterized protein n=1 Tax=Protopolystoma xenopodis TaxID=117903 RepID=A0A448XD56_9PLAT|nr:unnamed protein product [Protopolystoma xenopodis]
MGSREPISLHSPCSTQRTNQPVESRLAGWRRRLVRALPPCGQKRLQDANESVCWLRRESWSNDVAPEAAGPCWAVKPDAKKRICSLSTVCWGLWLCWNIHADAVSEAIAFDSDEKVKAFLLSVTSIIRAR